MKKISIMFFYFLILQTYAQEEISIISYFNDLNNKSNFLLGENTSIHFWKERSVCNNPEDNIPCKSCLDTYMIPFILEKIPNQEGFILHVSSTRKLEHIESFKFYCQDGKVYVQNYFSIMQCLGGVLSEDIFLTKEYQKKDKISHKPVELSFFDMLSFKKIFEPIFDRAIEINANKSSICQIQVH